MNILWITPDVPFGKLYGGNADISARIEFAAQCGHKIHLICFTKETANLQVVRDLERFCDSVNIIKRSLNFLQILNPTLPYSVSTRYSKKIPDIINSTIQHFGIDVACIESIHVGEIVPILKKTSIPIILRLHNIESYYFQELGRSHKSLPLKMVYMWEARKLIKYEDTIYDQFHKILCVSCHEAEQLKNKYPNNYIRWLPIPIKLEADISEAHDSGPIIVFSGSMYLPNNSEAVIWFAEKVFPRVLSSIPNAEFWIIGRNPSKDVRQLGKVKNIRITGEIPNSHRMISEARVVVVPLFHGAGVKIKILEAIGLGKLVLATSTAIIGTSLESGKHVLVADSPEAFAEFCIQALKEPSAFQDIKHRARNYFETHHTQEVVGKRLLSELSSLVDTSGEKPHAQN